MTSKIRTIYLLPHAHTDIGYSHDPAVALELHERFIDRAIELCEKTRGFPEGARFRWTVEVYLPVLRWWEHRDRDWRGRLRECLRRDEIALGARYLNGTESYAPEDVRWELGQLEHVRALTGYAPAVAIQNDVNGFPLAFAEPLARAGVTAVVMGLNTTMGHSPFARNDAFRWKAGDGRSLLVWNGWIYNRLRMFFHLDRLAAELPGRLDNFIGPIPESYPYDFVMTSATMGDNVGPFASLPDQVRQFNERGERVQLRLVTFAEFARIVAAQPAPLRELEGHWPDFWTFGLGAMPHMVASMRRAQRRLRLVELFRGLNWASVPGGTLTLDAARRSLALACEHTYDSHNSGSFTSDAIRQMAQTQVDASMAESASMVLLRDHLTAMAAPLPKEPVSVLAVNPHPWPLALDYLSEEKGLLNFARSRQPEHLFQFDREPTTDALSGAAKFGALDIDVPARDKEVVPLGPLPARTIAVLRSNEAALQVEGGPGLHFDPRLAGLSSWTTPLGEMLRTDAPYTAFEPVLESPNAPFQLSNSGTGDMDPADCGWNPDLTFQRGRLPGALKELRRESLGSRASLVADFTESPLERMTFTLDSRQPERLAVSADWKFDADPTVRAYYLALPLHLPGDGETEYWIDACGQWFRAGQDQLPGTCNSFYQACSGIAVSRGGRTVYIASADTPLFQCGGFTFGQLPERGLQRRDPFVALWIYNNYWFTNFPCFAPGLLRSRFLLEARPGPFDRDAAAQLDAAFDIAYLTHPVA